MLQVAAKPTRSQVTIERERKWLFPLLILAIGLATFLPTLGLVGIIDPSDGFFSESSREMFESGNFVVPHLNYEPYNNKPILTNWLICASYKLFGVSELTSRVPSALCAVLLSVATYLFARRFLSRRVATLSSLILLSSILFSALGRVSLTDMPLAFCVVTAMFALFAGLELRNTSAMTLGHVFLGLSFLTKGPIALLISGGTFLLYFLATRAKLSLPATIKQFQQLKLPRALAILAAINLPWFIAVGVQTHGAFISDFFFTENVMRAMGKIQMNHAEPPYFYLEMLAIGFFPWTVLFFGGVPALRKWWQHRAHSTARVRFLLFCGAAALTVLAGFSVLKGKLPTYILPMFPPLAILTAASLDSMARLPGRRALLWSGLVLSAATAAALVIMPLKLHLQAGNMLCTTIFSASCLITFIGFSALLCFKRPVLALWQVTASWALIAAALVPFLFVLFYNHHQRAYAGLLEEAQRLGKPVVEVVNESPSAPFYLHRHVPSLQNYFDLAYLLSRSPGERLVLCSSKFENLPQQAPVHRLIDRNQQYRLYAVADPEQKLLKSYFVKRKAAQLAYEKDPNEPDPARIVVTPSRSIFEN